MINLGMKGFYILLGLSVITGVIIQLLTPFLLPKLHPSFFRQTNHIGKTENLKSLSCEEFFHGKAWPLLIDHDKYNSVKLCQTVPGNDEVYFATMYNVKTRIPIYSANVVSISEDSPVLPRPESKFWNRVSQSLCSMSQVPEGSIASDIGHADDLEVCGHKQAETRDYTHNGMRLDRGHLSPNSINSNDHDKQVSTFTLTNAAPQFAEFNEKSWRNYECVAKQTIMDLAPNEKVYVMTGTFGAAKDSNGNDLWMNGDHKDEKKSPVLVPGYYWKAVCYPGNAATGKSPWGYALIQENVNEDRGTNPEEYLKIREFSDKYFKDDMFGAECMSAEFGEFASVFDGWDDYVEKYCPPPY